MTRSSIVSVVALAIVILSATPVLAQDNPVRDSQWHLTFLGVRQAQAITRGSGVTVAVIDTGVDANHPDLAGNVLPGVDLSEVGKTDGQQDIDGHGTSMAGLIAAHGSALGIAPAAAILPIRESVSKVDVRQIPPAIEWAVAHGANVILLSIAVPDNPELATAVARALDADVVVVAAAGNKADTAGVAYPAAYDGVIAVAGVGRDGQHADVSVVGFPVVLAAPAVDIISTKPAGQYGIGTGTSAAAAIVAGAAALVRSRYPNLSGRDVYRRLTLTADDTGAPGRDVEYGYGVVNPVRALTADVLVATDSPSPGGVAQPPEPTPSSLIRTVLIGVVGALLLLSVGGIVLAVRRRAPSE